jgi:hypothetical protein
MTTKKKLLHLVSGGQNAKRATGYEYSIDTDPNYEEVLFDQYYVQKENCVMESEDSFDLLVRMQ